MGRRRSRSNAEAAVELVALLPWWAGVVLALASYLILSSIAGRPVSFGATGSPSASHVASAVVRGLAAVGQYILPLMFLAAAGLSVYRRRQREQLLADATRPTAVGVVDGMRWQEFEMLVGEAFRRQGYQVLESGGGGADGGVDLVLSRPSKNGTEKTLVQCKHWRAYKVGVDVVRELYGVMAARGAAAGIVVTSGQFTAEAKDFAQGRNVQLIDGPALQVVIRAARSHPKHQMARDTESTAAPASAETRAARSGASPACPACGKPMVQRTAKRGAQAGNRFWGCTGYPSCRGIRGIDER